LQCASPELLDPAAVLATPVDRLRAAGLSAQKAAYIHDLAAHFSDGRLSTEKVRAMGPAELHKSLIGVKGLGPWSVDMFG
jgi:DNA-3-methyladenine glycosylase II